MTEPESPYLKKLEDILENGFGAKGDSLAEKLASVRTRLPDELAAGIESLVVGPSGIPGSESAAEFVFRCGQMTEQLRGVLHAQAAENVAASHPAGIPPEEMTSTDLDAVARFMAARDRFMRAVASFTLKALLIIIGLLIIGLALGIV